MKNFYLAAAVLGTILPYYYFGSFALAHNFDLALFVTQVIEARASMGFVVDLFISSFVFWPFMFMEARKISVPSPWIFIVLNLTIGLSCAFPLFLYFREKAISA